MKAVRIAAPLEIGVAEIERPALGAGEVLVKIRYVGFCGSDLNTYLGRNPMVKMPVVPGHEVGAVIEKVGEGVPATLREGMTVTLNPYTNCGSCASCRNGRYNACEHNETLGVQRQGVVGSPATYVMAVNEVGFTGCVTCIGYAKSEVSFQTKLFVQKELDIRGSRNATPSDFRAVINCIKTGRYPVDKFISRVVKPEDTAVAMKEWSENPGKVFRILVEF